MIHAFVQYMIDRDLVPAGVAKRLTDERRFVREPIGMIAVNHGLLRPNDIDVILDRQRECNVRFGDLAVEMGCLTREQVDTLLKIQDFRSAADLTEALALGDVLSCEDAIRCLGSYLVGDHEVIAMMADD